MVLKNTVRMEGIEMWREMECYKVICVPVYRMQDIFSVLSTGENKEGWKRMDLKIFHVVWGRE